jgi:protein TonB
VRGSVAGSTVVHLAALLVLFALRGPAPQIVPGPDVVQVAILEPSAVQPRTPTPKPAPEPEPVRAVPEIQPTEDTGVKLTPPKPKKKEPEPKPKPKEPPPSLSVALPSARIGSAGLTGEMSLDQTDFEFTYYLILVRNRIAQNWTPPAGLVSAGQPVRVVIYFKIDRGGEITDVRVESASRAEFFDRSAQRAVLISNPLPPLPLGYSGAQLGVHFGFEYSAP